MAEEGNQSSQEYKSQKEGYGGQWCEHGLDYCLRFGQKSGWWWWQVNKQNSSFLP
jgi:hypothetical protein